MSFDEELQRTIDALGARVREQVGLEVRAHLDAARAEMETVQARAIADLEEATRQRQEEVRAEAERAARERIAEAEQRAEDARAHAADAEARAAESQARMAESQAQAVERDARAAEREGRAVELEARIVEADGRAAAAEARAAEQQRRADDAHAQAREAGARADETLARARELEARVAELETRAGGLEARAVDANTRAATAEARAAEQQRRADDAHAQARQAGARADEALARVRQSEARIEEADARAAEAAQALEAARATLPAVSSAECLLTAVSGIDEARSLRDVLDRLVDGARGLGARAAVLLVRPGRFEGLQFAGFEPGPSSPKDVAIPLGDGGVLLEAVRRLGPVQSGSDANHSAPSFAGASADQECFALPLVLGGQPVAVFYADRDSTDGASEGVFHPDWLELLARYATQRLAVITAVKAACALKPTQAAATPERAAPHRSQEEDEEGARRYARLLVSEIRLYHEADVAVGRERRDLGTRLASEIARARVLYEQRVPPDVRKRADYFHAELVRTLADGDARLLEAST